MTPKSTVQDIRKRFDDEVERFSNLETGQTATVDAPLVLELIARCSVAVNPDAGALLDVGCGAGNYSLKLLQRLPDMDVMLLDLSARMLERARARVSAATSGTVSIQQGDVREVDLGEAKFDIIVASAVLHHLRADEEWRLVFGKLFAALKPGGSLWISDLVAHSIPAVQSVLWQNYGEYLAAFKGEEYREQVYAYIDREDSPKPLLFQCDLLREAGFAEIDLLHKNTCFAALGARKAS